MIRAEGLFILLNAVSAGAVGRRSHGLQPRYRKGEAYREEVRGGPVAVGFRHVQTRS